MRLNVKFDSSKSVDDYDDLQKVFKSCHPMFIMLRLCGFHISADGKSNSKCIIWLFRAITISIFAVHTWKFTYAIAFDGFQLGDLWIFVYNDSWIAFPFVYIIVKRGDKIAEFTINLMRVLTMVKFDDGVFREIRRQCLILVALLWLFVIVMACALPMLVDLIVALDNKAYIFVSGGFTPSDPTLRLTVAALNEAIYLIIFYSSEAFAVFIVLIVKLFDVCFRHISLAIKNYENESRSTALKFQQLHRKVTTLIEEFNEIFSPAVMALVLVKIGQITAACVNLHDTLSLWKSNRDPDGLKAALFFTLFPISKAVIPLLLLIDGAHNVHKHSVEIFGDLLNRYLHYSMDFLCESREMVKDCYVSLMSAFATLLTPPTINASGFFVINYNLVIIVVSIVVTYFAFIADVKQMAA